MGTKYINLLTDASKLISRVWYNQGMQLNLDANIDSESIRYKYSNDGDTDMEYLGTETTPNPLVVATSTSSQVVDVNFTVQYNANGGTGSMDPTTVTYGTYTALRSNTFTWTGYTFGGWYAYRNYDGTYRGYPSGSSVSSWINEEDVVSYFIYTDGCEVIRSAPTGTVIMYAIWIPNQ